MSEVFPLGTVLLDMNKPWSGEFVIENPEDLDDAARKMIVANIKAGQTPVRELVCVGWDGVSNPIYLFADEYRSGVPEHACMRPSYLDIQAWKRARAGAR